MIDKATESALVELEQLIDDDESRKVPLVEWESLDPQIAAIFPSWYRNLLARFRIAGTNFDVDKEDLQIWEIRFTSPEMVTGSADELYQAQWDFEALVESEYFPIAWGQDGGFFVALRSAQGPVSQFEATCLDGVTFVAAVAKSPSWESISKFIEDLLPEGYEG